MANLLGNKFDTNAATMLLKIKQEHPMLTTLCGFKGDETSIDFYYKDLGPADAMLIAPEISVMASLMECCVRGNNLDKESATMLAKAATENRVMLFGIKHDQKEADFSNQHLGPVDSILIASDMAASASLTECCVRGNNLDKESATMLAKVAAEKRVMLFGIKHDQKEADFSGQRLGPADGILIASDLAVSASLTSINLSNNNLTGVSETDFVHVSKVQGSSFNVGDKVVYDR